MVPVMKNIAEIGFVLRGECKKEHYCDVSMIESALLSR